MGELVTVGFNQRMADATRWVDWANRALGLEENTYYGHDWALASYAGAAAPYICAGRLQHGWNPGYPAFVKPLSSRLLGRLPPLVWSERIALEARKRHGIGHAIGSPFAYLHRSSQAQSMRSRPTESNRVLYYPEHSWEGSNRAWTPRVSPSEVRHLLGDDVTVCLYYFDASDANIALYGAQDLLVTSHGRTKADSQHLLNQYRMIFEHELVVTDSPGSALLYAAAVGREAVALYQDRDHGTRMDPTAISRDWAEEELGFDIVLSPSDLGEALGWTRMRQLRMMGRALYAAGRDRARFVRSAPGQ